jgi:hypothetical protein
MRHFFRCVAIATSSLVAMSGPAFAQLQQTVITGQQPAGPPRVDVERACPAIAETLNRELSPAMEMFGREGTVRVEFRIAGDAVESVTARGGPHEYRPFVRRAMRAVTCIPDSRGDRFVFSIRFDPEAPPEAPQRVARLVGR